MFSSANASGGLSITGLGLYNDGGALVLGNQLSTGALDFWSLNSAGLGAGTYYLQISGNVVGNTPAKYYSSITATALAPVPEPETYAMLLAGLGMLGYCARRRQQKSED